MLVHLRCHFILSVCGCASFIVIEYRGVLPGGPLCRAHCVIDSLRRWVLQTQQSWRADAMWFKLAHASAWQKGSEAEALLFRERPGVGPTQEMFKSRQHFKCILYNKQIELSWSSFLVVQVPRKTISLEPVVASMGMGWIVHHLVNLHLVAACRALRRFKTRAAVRTHMPFANAWGVHVLPSSLVAVLVQVSLVVQKALNFRVPINRKFVAWLRVGPLPVIPARSTQMIASSAMNPATKTMILESTAPQSVARANVACHQRRRLVLAGKIVTGGTRNKRTDCFSELVRLWPQLLWSLLLGGVYTQSFSCAGSISLPGWAVQEKT